MILIISEDSDLHAREVTAQLSSLDCESHILNLEVFPRDSRVSMAFTKDAPWSGRLSAASAFDLDLARVGAVWWRRPQGFELDPALRDEGYRLFALGECEEMFGGLWPSLDAFWLNDPKRDEVAHKKPYQLHVARQVGLEIPDTLTTNDPEAARRFVELHGASQVVYKSFSATYRHWRETRLLREDEASDLTAVRFCPVIFQEYVPCKFDLRVTVVDGTVFAAAIYSQETDYKVDFRMNMSNVRIQPYEMPEEVTRALLALMKRLGLVYGAADFRVTPEGRHVFLEINPAGQWLFVEEATGQAISRRIAETLAREDRAREDRAREDRARGGPEPRGAGAA